MDVTIIERGRELRFSGDLVEWREVRRDLEHERDMAEIHRYNRSLWGRLRRLLADWRQLVQARIVAKGR